MRSDGKPVGGGLGVDSLAGAFELVHGRTLSSFLQREPLPCSNFPVERARQVGVSPRPRVGRRTDSFLNKLCSVRFVCNTRNIPQEIVDPFKLFIGRCNLYP